MPEATHSQIVSRQVERIVRQLSSLSTLPTVTAELLRQMNVGQVDPVQLADNISADPALTAKVLMLAHREGVEFTNGPDIKEAVAKLPLAHIREAVVSVKVFQMLDCPVGADGKQLICQKQMAMHSLAVGCCAGLIAELVLPVEQRQTAYLAGLLHDIGKSALIEVMPKSFEKMIQQARDEQSGLAEVEQTHLGLDHTVLGRRLAQKWLLPEPIVSAIWLHHFDAQSLSPELPDADITRVVALADRLARRAGLGQSGSFDIPEGIEELAQLLSIGPEQLEEITQQLPIVIQQKCELLGLDMPDEVSHYYSLIHQTAADLAADNNRLSIRSQQAGQLCDQARLISDFLSKIDENAAAVDIAETLACCWQSHFRSGLTCVYIVHDSTEPYVELAVVDRRGRIDIKSFQMPENIPPVPEVLRTSVEVVPAGDGAKWLTEQLSADFNPQFLKMTPLKMCDETVGVVVYEGFGDSSGSTDTDGALICKVAAATITMALAVQKKDQLAERFVQVMNSLRKTRSELVHQQSLTGLAEMAAGAAHELNNPLAVISGRAQLLMDSEDDENKRQILEQIQSRTDEISHIISDLLMFAQPSSAHKRAVPVLELLSKAIEKTQQACQLASVEIEISGPQRDSDVYVDAHQVTQSISFILSNALQSYKGGNGPIRVDCSEAPTTNAVLLAISDDGCGMDVATLAHACEPFFSACPAGRRRGMGLAHAQRLLRLNGGGLKLASESNAGTTVTVTLPKV